MSSASPPPSGSEYGSTNQRGSALVVPPKRVHRARRFRPTSTGSTNFSGGSVVSGMSGSPTSYDDTSSMSTLTVQPTDTTSLLGGARSNSLDLSAPTAGGGGGKSYMLMDNPHGGFQSLQDDRSSSLVALSSRLSTPSSLPLSRPVSTQLDPLLPQQSKAAAFAMTTTTVVNPSSTNSRTSGTSGFSPSTRVSVAANSTTGSLVNPLRAARINVRAQQEEDEARFIPRPMSLHLTIGSVLYIAGYALMKLSYTRWGAVADIQRLEQGIYVNPLYKWIVVSLATTVLSLLITFFCLCLISAKKAYFLSTRVCFTYGLPAGVLSGIYLTIQYLPSGARYVWKDLSFEISILRVLTIGFVGLMVLIVHREFYNKTCHKPALALGCLIPLLTVYVSQVMADHRQLDHWDQLVLQETDRSTGTKWGWFGIYGLSYVAFGGSLVVINAFLRKTTARTEDDTVSNEAVGTLGYQAVAMNYVLGGGAHRHRRGRPLDQSAETFFPKSNWIITVAAFTGFYAFFLGGTLIITTALWSFQFFAGPLLVSPTVANAYDRLLSGSGCLSTKFEGSNFCDDFVNYIFTVACAGLLQMVGTVMVCLGSPALGVYNLLVTIPLTSILSQRWSLWHATGSTTGGDILSGISLLSTGNVTNAAAAGQEISIPVADGYEESALAFCILASIMHFYWQYKMTSVEEGPAADPLSPLEGIGAQIDGARPLDVAQP